MVKELMAWAFLITVGVYIGRHWEEIDSQPGL